jgi:hypothetical protein
MNDGKFGELDENYFDIYLQEYYLYCYSLLTSDKTLFLESSEGFTYVSAEAEQKTWPKVLQFISVAE